MVKYYKEEDNKLVEAPINFKKDDKTIICNFNINVEKMLEYGYSPYTDEEVQEYYKVKEQENPSLFQNNITNYRFSKLKVKEKLVELNLWDSVKQSLSEDEYEDLLLADDFSFDNALFSSFYNNLKEQIENIDDILMECIND